MARLYKDFIEGIITDNPLLIGATTINSAVFASLPAVVAPDTLRLSLDPERVSGEPEIVTVTAHTASATSVTVTRGSDGTTARQHTVNTKVVLSLVSSDLTTLQAAEPAGIGVTLRRSSDLALTSGSAITWNVEVSDADGFFDSGAPTRLTVPAGRGGLYLITASNVCPGSFSASTGYLEGRRDGSIPLGLAPSSALAFNAAYAPLAVVADLASGSYVEILVFHTIGGSALVVKENAHVSMVRLGS